MNTHTYDWQYTQLRQQVSSPLLSGGPMFFTSARIHEEFLKNLPVYIRQHYNCRACLSFFERYGNLAEVMDDGSLRSVLFYKATVGYPFDSFILAANRAVENALIVGPFVSMAGVYGTPESGGWSHFYTVASGPSVDATEQQITQRLNSLYIVINAYSGVLRLARNIANRLPRKEILVGPIDALIAASDRVFSVLRENRDNALWREAFNGAEWMSHIRGGAVGALLEMTRTGTPISTIESKMSEMLSPANYRRPVAPPKMGAVVNAAKSLDPGIDLSLARRFATMEDLEHLLAWRLNTSVKIGEQILDGGLTGSPSRQTKRVCMSLASFVDTILPKAMFIRALVPNEPLAFVALTAQENANANPILKWDRPDRRNHISWYVYVKGSHPAQWGIGQSANVLAVCAKPDKIGRANPMAEEAILILEGCFDTQYKRAGLALFPEFLAQNFREHERVIDFISKQGTITVGPGKPCSGVILTPKSRVRLLVAMRWETVEIEIA